MLARRNRRWCVWVRSLLWLLVVLQAPARGSADADEERASPPPPSSEETPHAAAGRTLFELARNRYDRGLREQDPAALAWALDALKLAFRLWPEPDLLHNMGQAARHLGRCAEAREYYRRYLAQHPDPARRAIAERHLAALGDCAGSDLRQSIAPLLSPLRMDAHSPPVPTPIVPETGCQRVDSPSAQASTSASVAPRGQHTAKLATRMLGGASVIAALGAGISWIRFASADRDLRRAEVYDLGLEQTWHRRRLAGRWLLGLGPAALSLGTAAVLVRLFWPAAATTPEQQRAALGLGTDGVALKGRF